MPKPRRKSQRRRAKEKEFQKPEYQKRVPEEKLFTQPGLRNHFDHLDATPFNCSLLAKGLADEQGGGMVYK